MDEIALNVTTSDPPAAVIERLTEALRSRGYGVLATLPIHEILQEKLGKRIDPLILLEVCAPRHAFRALSTTRSAALLLPCKIMVSREGPATTVALLRPTTALGRLMPAAGLEDLGREVEAELSAALDEAVRQGRAEPATAPPAPHPHHGTDRPWSRAEGMALLEGGPGAAGLDAGRFWERVRLQPGRVVVDVGAGAGRFAVPAAQRVGTTGKVYAVEVSAELVAHLAETARTLALPQLLPVQGGPGRIPLPDGVADVVVLANVLHDISAGTVRESVRVLRRGGFLVNLDWKKEPTPLGPPESIRLTPQQAAERLSAEGVHEVDRWEAGPYHYAVRFEKPL